MMRIPLTFPLHALNHLLAQESWATEQLKAHTNKVACIDFGGLALRMKITAQGLVETAPDDAEANVTIHINPANIPLILQNQERAISYVKLEGDADLAQTFSELAKNLRWDVEQDLSRWFGDMAGRRLAQAGKAAIASLQSNAQKLQDNLADYFLEENPLLMRASAVNELMQEILRMRDDVERLEKRIAKCEKTLHVKHHGS